jgi:hypothetical protein
VLPSWINLIQPEIRFPELGIGHLRLECFKVLGWLPWSFFDVSKLSVQQPDPKSHGNLGTAGLGVLPRIHQIGYCQGAISQLLVWATIHHQDFEAGNLKSVLYLQLGSRSE